MRTFPAPLFICFCLTACGRDPLLSNHAPDGDTDGAVEVRRAFFLPNDLPNQWAAYQDGSGPWIPVQPIEPNGQEYELVLRDPSRQLGFALAADLGQEHVEVVVSFLTVDDCLRGVDLGTSAPQAIRTSPGQISWSVGGLKAGEHATVSVAGQSFETKAEGGGGSSASSRWPSSGDLLATAGPTDGLPTRMIIRRGLRLTDGMTIPTLDFSGAESFPLRSDQLTITNAPIADEIFTGVSLTTAGGTVLLSQETTTPATTVPFMALPAAKQAAGDLYEAAYYYTSSTASAAVFDYFRSPSGHVLVVPAIPSDAKVWNSGGPGDVRLTAEWPVTEPGAIRFANYTQGPDLIHSKWWQVTVSPGYPAGAVTVPDLRDVAGWNAAWDLSVGELTTWGVGSSVSSSPGASPGDGTREVSTTQRGTIVP
jgi:hypothetical protein